jgi:hypothetical protein
MMTAKSSMNIASVVATSAALLLAGCGGALSAGNGASLGSSSPLFIQGLIHGGQQPVSNSTLQLYAVGTGGYNTAANPLLDATVKSAADGSFSISSHYNCTGSDQVYIVATGGNPGIAPTVSNPTPNNAALVEMAALGSCANLLANASTTFINMSEVTTVAGAWSLARFMNSPSNAGTSTGNVSGLESAFTTANRLANLATGTASGPALPPGATVSVPEINTLANILASCINTDGSTAAGTPCNSLFAAATPPSGTAPTDTLTAALNIAHFPSNNAGALYLLSTGVGAPYQPFLPTAPTNWLIGIHYTGGGLSQPAAVAVDNSGNIWVANKGNNSVSEFALNGSTLSPSTGYIGGSLSGPSAIAIDLTGQAWVTNSTGASLTRVAPLGTTLTNFSAGGFNLPSSIAIDGTGNIWVANKGNSTLSELSSSGSVVAQTPYTGAGISEPTAIAISAQ